MWRWFRTSATPSTKCWSPVGQREQDRQGGRGLRREGFEISISKCGGRSGRDNARNITDHPLPPSLPPSFPTGFQRSDRHRVDPAGFVALLLPLSLQDLLDVVAVEDGFGSSEGMAADEDVLGVDAEDLREGGRQGGREGGRERRLKFGGGFC